MDTDMLEPLIKVYIGQMDSAMKVSETLANHASSEEITVDHVISGLVYRLMVPMTNEEITSSLERASEVLDTIYETDSDGDGESEDGGLNGGLDQETLDGSIDFGSRKVVHPVCNCEVCMKVRICLLNYHSHECSDTLAQKFRDAINHTCETHKIYV